MIDTLERQEIIRDLSTSGYSIKELKNLDIQPRMTYYTPDGRAIPNLPADPYSLMHYKRRGLTLTPPLLAAEEIPPPASPRKRRVIKHRKSRGKIKGGISV